MILEVDTKVAYVVTILAGDPQFILRPGDPGWRDWRSKEGREAYRKTDWWYSIQHLAKARFDNRCALCGRKHTEDSPLEIHDRVYRPPFTELSCDMVLLCQKCHSLFHEGHEPYNEVTDTFPYLEGLPSFADPDYLAKRRAQKEQRRLQREQAMQEEYDYVVPF